jgi:hypothetical protein
MNPELGPVVAASPERRLSYLSGWSNGIFKLVRDGRVNWLEKGYHNFWTDSKMSDK